jgi:hypothetical protein
MDCVRSGVHLFSMSPSGFWNDLPVEEERVPRAPVKPNYGRRELMHKPLAWVDMGELTIFLGIVYASIGCARVAILFLDWWH